MYVQRYNHNSKTLTFLMLLVYQKRHETIKSITSLSLQLDTLYFVSNITNVLVFETKINGKKSAVENVILYFVIFYCYTANGVYGPNSQKLFCLVHTRTIGVSDYWEWMDGMVSNVRRFVYFIYSENSDL